VKYYEATSVLYKKISINNTFVKTEDFDDRNILFNFLIHNMLYFSLFL